GKTVNYVFDQKKPSVSPAERKRIDRDMPNELRGELAYKVRPLNGVWATPPYLHNGSVPTVEALLGPPEDRPKKFYLGNREYDPVNLGYKFDKITNGFEFDTSIRGNSNRGHEFRKDYSKDMEIKGVIGPALSADDRKALIEYLKTLKSVFQRSGDRFASRKRVKSKIQSPVPIPSERGSRDFPAGSDHEPPRAG